ncbi:MBOAT, membrane-bound O-acyltransferase family-domain-containing protein [Echria macrotheca]|uniref:MBOAT, membrane-bound O-acyltransferase family-domain-containing protein n=1 Tax=Echria macrotheca TaxID=438768 RepID=A0AAJ0B4T0_9PEZI|nr:MBOAT, membrane-bound O-acyltransferase family-domain-containing protein [Echria macrotheca]
MIPYIDIPFAYLGRLIGASPDELKLIFSFLLSYPLAGLLKRVPDARPAYKNLFSLGVSFFYLVGLFNLWDGLRTLLFSAAGAYAIAKFLRGEKYMPWVGFVFLMGHMSINQIARMRADNPRSVDVTGAQMVLVMKLSSFCWNVADGALPESELSDFQKDRRLTELPNLLDYAGYVFFFPSLLVGPAFDFVEYRRWLDCSMFDVPVAVDPAKKPPTRRKRKIPRSGTPAMRKLIMGLAWLGLYVKLSGPYDPNVLLSDKYAGYDFLKRVLVLHMVPFTARTKYYAVWTLTEGACILTGLGYNGVDPATGKVSWDRLVNIKPMGVELAQNTRGYLENWNINTNKWLRNCIYLRVTPRGQKPGFRATVATFFTSAFWHGFYPGYYLSFLLASFIQTVAKNFRRYLRPFFLDPKTQAPLPTKKYYDFFSWLVTQVTFSFVTAPFLILSLSGSLTVWSRVYFYAVIGTALSWALFESPAKPALRRALEQRAAAAGAGGEGGKKEGQKQTGGLPRSASTDSLASREPVLGLSAALDTDLDAAIEEIKAGVEMRRASLKAAQQRSKRA